MKGGNLNLGMASLADTGQWKLIVEISSEGISANLKNVDYSETPIVSIFSKEWPADEENLLANVEAAIYDNPRILEDFATHIILDTSKSLWIPTEETEDEEFDDSLFTCVFPASPGDIGADFGNEEVCLYTLCPGLNSFLKRTLPGSKISSHISILKESFERMETGNREDSDVGAIYLNIIPGQADIFAFGNGKFICAASHPWEETSDLAYKALLAAQTYGLEPRQTRLYLIANGNSKEDLMDYFSQFFPKIYFLEIIRKAGDTEVSFATAIAAGHPLQITENENH